MFVELRSGPNYLKNVADSILKSLVFHSTNNKEVAYISYCLLYLSCLPSLCYILWYICCKWWNQ